MGAHRSAMCDWPGRLGVLGRSGRLGVLGELARSCVLLIIACGRVGFWCVERFRALRAGVSDFPILSWGVHQSPLAGRPNEGRVQAPIYLHAPTRTYMLTRTGMQGTYMRPR
jgi:hypothetical protein